MMASSEESIARSATRNRLLALRDIVRDRQVDGAQYDEKGAAMGTHVAACGQTLMRIQEPSRPDKCAR